MCHMVSWDFFIQMRTTMAGHVGVGDFGDGAVGVGDDGDADHRIFHIFSTSHFTISPRHISYIFHDFPTFHISDSSDSDYSHIYGRLPIPTRGVRKFPTKPLFLRYFLFFLFLFLLALFYWALFLRYFLFFLFLFYLHFFIGHFS